MSASLASLEQRRDATIARIAEERVHLAALVCQLVPTVRKAERVTGRVKRGWQLVSHASAYALPVLSFVFRKSPVVRWGMRGVAALKFAKQLGIIKP